MEKIKFTRISIDPEIHKKLKTYVRERGLKLGVVIKAILETTTNDTEQLDKIINNIIKGENK
jgi:hypothetical protein